LDEIEKEAKWSGQGLCAIFEKTIRKVIKPTQFITIERLAHGKGQAAQWREEECVNLQISV